ncbi:MAG: hypothetical protein RJB42_1433 [Bacteroidota bacterium]|jgi:hypothetical protein
MTTRDIPISIDVKSEQEARHVQQALQSIAKQFTAEELVKISKKLELPLVKLKIKSMI